MAWETRNGRGRYYTRSRKVDGRVQREYVGSGEVAALCAELDQRERREEDAKRKRWREERERLSADERDIEAWYAMADRLLRAELTVAGYRQHARGEWRLRRV